MNYYYFEASLISDIIVLAEYHKEVIQYGCVLAQWGLSRENLMFVLISQTMF